MDDFCTSQSPNCVYPGVDSCQNSGTICNARYTPKDGDPNHEWRCLADTALTPDGQVWKDGEICLVTMHDALLPIVLRYPVLGDFEKQLWLDTFCQNQDMSGCSQAYFADYNATSQELVCRTVATTTSCPVITALHEGLFNMTTGKDIRRSNSILVITIYENAAELLLFALRFGHTEQQIAGTCCRDMLQGHVAGSNFIVCHRSKPCRGDKKLSPRHAA